MQHHPAALLWLCSAPFSHWMHRGCADRGHGVVRQQEAAVGKQRRCPRIIGLPAASAGRLLDRFTAMAGKGPPVHCMWQCCPGCGAVSAGHTGRFVCRVDLHFVLRVVVCWPDGCWCMLSTLDSSRLAHQERAVGRVIRGSVLPTTACGYTLLTCAALFCHAQLSW